MLKQTKLNIFIEILKSICFLGLIVSIYDDNLSGIIIYGFTTILGIFIKEWSVELK